MASDIIVSADRPPIRVGVIGVGRQALQVHLPAMAKMPELFTVVAVCDILKARRDIVEQTYNPKVRHYRQIEDMLDDQEIDLVLIALPSNEHFKAAMSSLDRGRWTVIENPPALTHDETTRLRATAQNKARGRLLFAATGIFSPDFRLAKEAVGDKRLGEVYEIIICNDSYCRRDDWQAVKRCGGGVLLSSGMDAILQAVKLLPSPPCQLWSDLKRIAALGDCEDFARIAFKTRGPVSAVIEINGGRLPPARPSFTVYGSRGTFSVEAGAREGLYHVIDPDYELPRRRSSVRTPPLEMPQEHIPTLDIPVALPEGEDETAVAFWRSVANTVRNAAPAAVSMDEAVDVMRYIQLVKKASQFSS